MYIGLQTFIVFDSGSGTNGMNQDSDIWNTAVYIINVPLVASMGQLYVSPFHPKQQNVTMNVLQLASPRSTDLVERAA